MNCTVGGAEAARRDDLVLVGVPVERFHIAAFEADRRDSELAEREQLLFLGMAVAVDIAPYQELVDLKYLF